MTLALSGSTLTQSGVNVDLSEFATVAGATTSVAGGKTFYFMPPIALNIEGELSIDPDIECLVFPADAPFQTFRIMDTGVCNFGVERVQNGVTYYSTGVGLVITRGDGRFFNSKDAGLFINGGGFNAYGGVVQSGLMTGLTADASVHIETMTLYNLSETTAQQIRFDASTDKLQNVVIKELIFDGRFNPIKPFFEGEPLEYSFIYKHAQFQSWSSGDQEYIFRNFDFTKNKSIIDHEVLTRTASISGLFYYVNNSSGSAIRSASQSGIREDTLETIQNVKFSIYDLSGAPLSDIQIYMPDYNDGARKDPSDRVMNYADDRDYTATTVNGVAEIDVLTSVHTYNSGLETPSASYRSRDSDTSDVYDIYFTSYHYSTGQTARALKGLGGTDIDWTLFVDRAISEPSIATVMAYTDIDTSAKFYDRAKAFYVSETRAQSDLFVERTGDVIDAGDYDVIIDPNAAEAFDITGTTITLRASVFTGGMTTAGNITLLNGASIDGIYTDSSGTYTSVEVNVKDIVTGDNLEGAQVYIEAGGVAVINGLTDVNGNIVSSYLYGGSVSIAGRARKSTSQPYFKTTDISGTVTEAGFRTSIFLLRD